jgi:hypothetical protein
MEILTIGLESKADDLVKAAKKTLEVTAKAKGLKLEDPVLDEYFYAPRNITTYRLTARAV